MQGLSILRPNHLHLNFLYRIVDNSRSSKQPWRNILGVVHCSDVVYCPFGHDRFSLWRLQRV